MAQAIAKIQREETYHQMHIGTWLQRLANGTPEARQLLEQALVQLWPDALGIFEPFADEETLLAAGILPDASEVLQQQWLSSIAPIITQLNLPVPLERVSRAGVAEDRDRAEVLRSTVPARYGGRQGQHNADFADLWEQMTMVYRLDPQASW
ncbi:Phenylacetic acid catabolic protein [Dictyobacter vulcani]|nr:Phenylacetic acid catabolic protein [Dictyobacter vulcani]